MASTPVNPVGDSVRLVDDERLDIPDARALQTLIYEYVADAIGGLVGETSGALTDITFTTGDNAAIGIGECTLCGFKRKSGSSARVRGGIFHFDPTSNYQAGSATVDVSAYAGDAVSRPYLWFKRVELPADLATRHKYDATSEREETFSLNTRLRTKLSFAATATRTTGPDSLPEATSEWFVFAQVREWNATVPTIQPVHPFDVGIVPDDFPATGTATPWVGSWLRQYAEAFSTPPSYRIGLAQFLTFIGQRLAFTMDGDWLSSVTGAVTGTSDSAFGVATGGGAAFTRGVRQLDADLATLEAAAGAQPIMLAWGFVDGSGPPFSSLVKRSPSTGTDSHVNNSGVYLLYIPDSYSVLTVSVVPLVDDTAASAAGGGAGLPVCGASITPGVPDTEVKITTYEDGVVGGGKGDRGFYITVWGTPV